MTVISTHNAEHYLWGGQCHGWHLAKTEHLSVIKEFVPYGYSEVRHYHLRSEQFFYILSGIATMEVGGIVHRLEPGEGIHVPAGFAHQMSNEHELDLVFIVTSTPPSHGDRIDIQ